MMSDDGTMTRGTSSPRRAPTPGAREQWLARTRGARFVRALAPTVGCIVALGLATVVIGSTGDLATVIYGLAVLLFMLPCALVGGLVGSAVLASRDSPRGAGTVGLIAVASGIAGLAIMLLPSVIGR